MHSDILNYTKLAFNSLKMIQNDSLSANQTGDDRPLKVMLFVLSSFIDMTIESSNPSTSAHNVQRCHTLSHLNSFSKWASFNIHSAICMGWLNADQPLRLR